MDWAAKQAERQESLNGRYLLYHIHRTHVGAKNWVSPDSAQQVYWAYLGVSYSVALMHCYDRLHAKERVGI